MSARIEKLIWSVLTAACLALWAYAALRVQTGRADRLLLRASQAESTGQAQAALALYSQVLQVRATDTAALQGAARTMLADGEDHLSQLAQARSLLETALRTAGDGNPELVALLGSIYMQQEEWDRAIGLYEQALKGAATGPTATEFNQHLAQAYLARQQTPADIQGAVAAVETALKADESQPQAWQLLALARLAQGRPAEAVEAASRAMGLAGDDWQSHYALGCALAATGAFAEADKVLSQAIELSAGVALPEQFLAARAISALMLGRVEEAKVLYESLNPHKSGPTGKLGALASAMAAGNRQRIVTLLDDPQLMESIGTSRDLLFKVACLYQLYGRNEQAQRLYERLVAERPVYAAALPALAVLQATTIQVMQGHLERALGSGLSDPRLAFNLATLEIEADKPAQALVRLEAVSQTLADWQAPRVNHAQALIDLGKIQDAQAVYQEISTSTGARMEALLGLGQLAARSGDMDQAVELLQQAQAGATSPLPHLLLAQVLTHQRRWPEAAQEYQRCLELEPGYGPALLGQGLCALEAGDLEQARRLLAPLTSDKHGPLAPVAENVLGVLALRAGDTASAEKHFQSAVGGPGEVKPAAQSNLALLAGVGKEDAPGLMAALQTIAGEPEAPPELLHNLAWLQGSAGNVTAAKEGYRKALERDPALGETACNLALLHLAAGESRQAGSIMQDAVNTSHQPAASWQVLIAALMEQDEAEAARRALEQALQAHPQAAGLHLLAAQQAWLGGEYEKAVEAARLALVDTELAAAARCIMGMALAKAGDIEKGRQEFQEALRRDPGNVTARLNLALLNLNSGDKAGALQALEGIEPGTQLTTRMLNLLGSIYSRAGRYDQAQRSFRQSLDLNPSQPQVLEALQRVEKM